MKNNLLKVAVIFITAAVCANAHALSPKTMEFVPPHDMPWSPAVTNETKITADKMDFDYRYSIGTFVGNVVVRDPMFTAIADRAVVVFATNRMNDVKSVVITGNARIRGLTEKGESVSAVCRKAVYSGDNASVIMEGPPPPVVWYGDKAASGDKLILWVNDGRVEIPSAAVISVPADELHDKDTLDNLKKKGSPKK